MDNYQPQKKLGVLIDADNTQPSIIEGLDNVVSTSEMRPDSTFSEDYGLQIVDGPMAGLMARTVIILDENGKVTYTELVPEIAQEPDYASAIKALK